MALLIALLGLGTAYKLAQVDPAIRDAVQKREMITQRNYSDFASRSSIPVGEEIGLTVTGMDIGILGLPKYFVEHPDGTRYMLRRKPASLRLQNLGGM
jgi:hypothetical protein